MVVANIRWGAALPSHSAYSIQSTHELDVANSSSTFAGHGTVCISRMFSKEVPVQTKQPKGCIMGITTILPSQMYIPISGQEPQVWVFHLRMLCHR